MQRRTFIISTATAVCGLAGWQLATSSMQSALVKLLHKRLSYLKLDEAGVRQFAADMTAHDDHSRLKLTLIDAAGPLYEHSTLEPRGKLTDAIRWGEERYVTLYLLSSDFFRNGCDTGRTLHYVSFYDPLIACGNPFARPIAVATVGTVGLGRESG